ncbi:MAG: glycosyltransferase [Methylococcales bacterium]|nr:glycosyltransferase [Methylococcales bacterium]
MTDAKTILFVALPYSVHTARWVAQLHEQGYELHLFPSIVTPVHPKLTNITVHYGWHKQYLTDTCPHQANITFWLERLISIVLRRCANNLLLAWRGRQLATLIQRLQPDIVHAMEIQAAGYLTLNAKKHLTDFPSWIMTIWGSDIYWFGRFAAHKEKIRQVLSQCDYFFCECQRDKQLATAFGFNKTVLPILPATGGFDLASLAHQRHAIPPSKRNVIALKGYQHWVGRALVALQALELCLDELQGYQIIIYSATPNVIKAAHLFTQKTGIPTKIIPNNSPHADILAVHEVARLSIALSLSDGLSNAMLEAMAMGSFPVQTCTSCADEWIEHGVSGAIVPVDDPEIVAMWIRKALTDDELVNHAAAINWQTALDRLDSTALTEQAIDIYKTIKSQ